MLLLCCCCGGPWHRSTCRKQACFSFLQKTYLAWNGTPTAAHQNWRGLQICFLFALVVVHIAERLTEHRAKIQVLGSSQHWEEKTDAQTVKVMSEARVRWGQVVRWPKGESKGGLRPLVGVQEELWIQLPGGGRSWVWHHCQEADWTETSCSKCFYGVVMICACAVPK